MTTRDMGFVLLKGMGLFFLVAAVFNFMALFTWLGMSPSQEFPSPETFAASAFLNLVVDAVLSGGCLFLTNRIASWLFGDDPEPTLTLSDPERFLTVGVILIGVGLFGGNVAAIARFAIELFWNLEGSRRPILADFLMHTWYDSGVSIGTAIVGAVLMVRGERIAARVSPWRQLGDEPQTVSNRKHP